MEPGRQAEADRRFETALASSRALDPRPRYRDFLRLLREKDESAYARMVERWKAEVVAPIAEGADDPLGLWLEFGLELARTLQPGSPVLIDETGRATPLEGAPPPTAMVLHLPDQARERALAVCLPPDPAPAQRAAEALLVEGRVKLPEEG